MDPIGQGPASSIASNCGNVTGSYNNVWNNCNIAVADEKRAVLEWLSPLEPRERHQAIGIDRMLGVGDGLLLTNEFTQWNQSGDGSAKPVLLSLFSRSEIEVGCHFTLGGEKYPVTQIWVLKIQAM